MKKLWIKLMCKQRTLSESVFFVYLPNDVKWVQMLQSHTQFCQVVF